MPGPVEQFLRFTGAWDDAAAELESRETILALARQDGVTVSDEELQDAVDAFREQRGLLDPLEMRNWLADTGLELEDVEREVEARLLNDKLCDRLTTGDVEAEFQRQRIRFDSVRLKVFVFGHRSFGELLAQRLRTDRDAFDGASLERSVDRRMEWGWYFREELPEQVATQVFRAMPGDVVGPVQVAEDQHAVYAVEQLRPAVMDADVERQIRSDMVMARARMLKQPDDPRHFVLK